MDIKLLTLSFLHSMSVDLAMVQRSNGSWTKAYHMEYAIGASLRRRLGGLCSFIFGPDGKSHFEEMDLLFEPAERTETGSFSPKMTGVTFNRNRVGYSTLIGILPTIAST